MNFKLPLALSSWGHEEINAMQKIIDSGVFTMGEHVKQFERSFAQHMGSKYCVMVNSGSSANLLMVASLFYTTNDILRLKPGDEVIVPAVSWSTTYYPLNQYNLKVKFVDIDIETLNFDLRQLESAVTQDTKAIFAVNLLGNPNDFHAIQQIIGGRNIHLIEDNCEAMGAEYKGRKTGTFGVMGTFSTFFSHHMSTMEGGLVVTDDEELYHILLSLRAHGWTRNLPPKNKVSDKQADDFLESFRFVLPGYNVRPLELSGAIGIEQLKKLPSFIATRRNNAKVLLDLFEDHTELMLQKNTDNSSWFGFSLVIRPNSKLRRDELIARLQNNQVDCRPIVAGNFVRNEVMKYFNYTTHGDLVNADYIHDNGLFIGNHHINMEKELKILADILS